MHLKYYESSLYDDTIIEYHGFQFDDPLLAQSTSFNVYLAGAKGVDWTQIKSDIQLLLLDDNLLLNVTEELPIAMEIKGEKVQQQWNILLFLSAMLFVFMIVYFTHRCKEIGIRKLNGNRFYTIYQKLFLPFVYMVMLSYTGMYGFLFLWKIHDFSTLAWEFMSPLLLLCVGIAVVLLCSSLLVAYTFYHYKTLKVLHNRLPLRPFSSITSVLKILAILVIVSPCLAVWKEGKEQFKAVQNGYRYEDFYKSYAVIERTSAMSSIDRQKLFNDAYLTLSKHGAIYADYANYRLIPNEEGVYEEDTNNGAPKEIFINNNFMKKFPIKDVDGNLIQLEDTQNALLMPMAYKDSNYDYTSSFCQGQVVCDLIYIPDDTTLPVIDSLNYYAQYDIQGAIINVVNVPKTTYSINVVYHSLFVNTKGEDPTQYVKNVLKDNKMSKQIDATAMTKLVHQSRDVLFSKIKKTGL